MFALMTRPGEGMTPPEVAHLAGVRGLEDPGVFSQRLQAARRVLGEGGHDGKAEPFHFLHSGVHPYNAWWNLACTYVVIEPAAWVEQARIRPGCAWPSFHAILFGYMRLSDAK